MVVVNFNIMKTTVDLKVNKEKLFVWHAIHAALKFGRNKKLKSKVVFIVLIYMTLTVC